MTQDKRLFNLQSLTDTFLFFNYSLHSILFCIGFRCTTQWSDNHTLYTSVPLNISSTHLAPYRVITKILLTIFFMLYFTSLWLFCNNQFVLLNPFTSFTHSPTSILSGNHYFGLCVYESVSILFVHLFCSLDSTWKWNHVLFVFLWLTYFT